MGNQAAGHPRGRRGGGGHRRQTGGQGPARYNADRATQDARDADAAGDGDREASTRLPRVVINERGCSRTDHSLSRTVTPSPLSVVPAKAESKPPTRKP